MVIYIETPLDEDLRSQLKLACAEDECIFKGDLQTHEDRVSALSKAEIIFGNPRPASLLSDLPKLKWIQLYSAGFEYYSELTISATVTNMRDFFSEPCAETAIAGILSLYRGMSDFALLKQEKKWVGQKMRPALNTLQKKSVLILGAGNIGKRIEKILMGFDCNIHFYARTRAERVVTTIPEVEALIPTADIIIACLPGTEETKGFFKTTMIKLMKPSAIFVNVGRGNLVADELALAKALMNHEIGGAVLDVTFDEPLPADHPLWTCPNTILSQHSAGGDANESLGLLNFFLENLQRYKTQQPLLNQVQLNKGY